MRLAFDSSDGILMGEVDRTYAFRDEMPKRAEQASERYDFMVCDNFDVWLIEASR